MTNKPNTLNRFSKSMKSPVMKKVSLFLSFASLKMTSFLTEQSQSPSTEKPFVSFKNEI